MGYSHATTSADQPGAQPGHRRPGKPVPRPLPASLLGRIDGHLATFAGHMREGLLAASTAVGLEVMAELMAAETDALAGAKGKHQPDRLAYRHGSEAGTVTLGGRRLPVRRPRVRTTDGAAELALASYEAFRSADLLATGVVARMLAGLSTRRYGAGLEPVGAAIEARMVGTSRSAVSRRFLAATSERLTELLSRPLADQRFLAVFLDGFGMGEHLLVGALGVPADGRKVSLGVVEGTTENAAVVNALLADLRERGLDASAGDGLLAFGRSAGAGDTDWGTRGKGPSGVAVLSWVSPRGRRPLQRAYEIAGNVITRAPRARRYGGHGPHERRTEHRSGPAGIRSPDAASSAPRRMPPRLKR